MQKHNKFKKWFINNFIKSKRGIFFSIIISLSIVSFLLFIFDAFSYKWSSFLGGFFASLVTGLIIMIYTNCKTNKLEKLLKEKENIEKFINYISPAFEVVNKALNQTYEIDDINIAFNEYHGAIGNVTQVQFNIYLNKLREYLQKNDLLDKHFVSYNKLSENIVHNYITNIDVINTVQNEIRQMNTIMYQIKSQSYQYLREIESIIDNLTKEIF